MQDDDVDPDAMWQKIESHEDEYSLYGTYDLRMAYILHTSFAVHEGQNRNQLATKKKNSLDQQFMTYYGNKW